MRTPNHKVITVAAALAVSAAACDRPGQTEEAAAAAGGAITIWTDSTELFMEHPALIVGQPDKFAVHLTDLTDFAPLRSGRITLRFTPRGGGNPLVVLQDSPRAPGIYGPAPEFTAAGTYDLVIEVESPQARDRIDVPGLVVYAKEADAPRESGAEPAGISFLKEQQWKTPGFATAFAARGTVAQSFQAGGEIVPAAGRFAEIAAPIDALVSATGVGSSPVPGQRVTRGAVLAVLTPTVGEGGGSAYASARRELREAQDEYERAKRLAAAEAIPARRLHEADLRLQAAREALAGLAGGVSADGRLALRTPINGVIGTRNITPGSRVAAGQLLFTVVDPSVVWLRVNVPAAQASLLGAGGGASFRVGAFARAYEARRTISVGSMVDPASRSVPVIYEVANHEGTLKIGSIATVAVRTGALAEGVLIPATAIVEEDGRPIAYVQAEGERFERRDLTLGATDQGMTHVVSGINEGERVVTGAAYQVRLASLSTGVPAHGHEH